MKKLFALLSLALVFAACTDDDATPPAKIVLSSDNPAVTIGADGKSAAVALTSLEGGMTAAVNLLKRTEVEVKSNSGWCAAAIAENEITISAKSATQTDRSAVVSITEVGGGKLGEITVNQSATPTLTLSEAVVNAAGEGETRMIQITTNQAEWSATNSASWIKTATEGDKLTLTIDPNPDSGTRSAVVTVTAGKENNSISLPIDIKQVSTQALLLEYTLATDGLTVRMPFSGKVNCVISWGDGSENESFDTTVTAKSGTINHTYEKAGIYTVCISGSVEQLYSILNHTTESRSLITAVKQWGFVGLTSMEAAFLNCINLASIPENTQNSFREVTTFKDAFKETNLKSIPCSLFKGCSKVTNVAFCFTACKFTEIPAGLLDDLTNATECNSLFSSCRALTTIPAGLFDKVTKTVNLANVFSTDSELTAIPAGLFKNLSQATNFTYTFYGCTKLTAIPDELFAGCSSAKDFTSAFFGCTAMTSVGNNVFKGCSAVTTYKWLFANCKELQNVPVNIFDDSKKVTNFSGTFRDNAKLATESPYTMIEGRKVHLYERAANTTVFTEPSAVSTCFRACTSLSDWNTINTSYNAWTK